jgi:DNA-binding NarL/FixJ family response regulator
MVAVPADRQARTPDLDGREERLSNKDDVAGDAGARAWAVRAADGGAVIDGGACDDFAGAFVIVSLPLGAGQWQRQLTEAERDIAQQILLGESNKRIAERRGTSARTVANQIAGIYQKLGIASRAELAARATRRTGELS